MVLHRILSKCFIDEYTNAGNREVCDNNGRFTTICCDLYILFNVA